MRILTVISLLLVSLSALARPAWKKIAEDREVAHNVQEFQALQKKYPERLKDVDTNNLTRGYVETDTWEYVASTVCNMDDPRLVFKAYAVFTCYKLASGEKCSTSPATPPESHQDPCAP